MSVDTLYGWNKLVNRGNDVFSALLMPHVLTPLLQRELKKIPTAKTSKPTNLGDGTPDQMYKNHDVVTVTTNEDAVVLLKTFLALMIPNILSQQVVEEREFQQYYIAYKH